MVRTEGGLNGDAQSDSTRPRSRAARGDGDLLREEILDAAELLLVERGRPDGVSMRLIAAKVGVTPTAIYLHFSDKNQLFFQVCSRRFLELRDVVDRASSSGSPTKRVEAIVRGFIGFGLERGDLYRAMYRVPLPELSQQELDGLASSQVIERTRQVLVEGIDLGEFRSGLDPQLAASTIWSVVHGTILIVLRRHEIGGQLLDTNDMVDSTVDVLLRGFRA